MVRPRLIGDAIGATALAVVAGAARLRSWPEVVRDGVVLPLASDGDSAYHLRRSLLTVADFPHAPVFDPLMNWPQGGLGHFSPGFDVLSAGAALLAGGRADPTRAALVVALVPALLGVLVVLETARATAALAPPAHRGAAGLAAGLVAALLPVLVLTSPMGRTDHHVAEVLVMTLLAHWALWRPASGARFELAGLAAVAGGVWVFGGAVLYVAVATAMLALRSTTGGPQRSGLAGSGTWALLGGAGAVTLLHAPVVAEHGHAWSYVFPSFLQPTLLATAGLGLALLVLGRRAWKRGRRARLGVAAGAVALGGVGIALGGRQIAAGLLEWGLRRDAWLAEVAESLPTLGAGWPADPAAWSVALRALGWLAPPAPLLLAAGAWLTWRQDRARGVLVAAWFAPLFLLGLLQQRFLAILAVPLAVSTGLVLSAATARLGPRWGSVTAVGAALGLALAQPAWRQELAPPPPPGSLGPAAEAAFYIRGAAPRDRVGPGVLAPWDLGHLVLLLSGRPVVANGFGRYLDRASFDAVLAAYQGGEDEVLRRMAERDLGWWLAGAATFVQRRTLRDRPDPFLRDEGGPWRLNPAFVSALPAAAAVAGGSGLAGSTPHFEHLAPVFASPDRMPDTEPDLPWLWVFEPVEGAVITGSGQPGDRVVASLGLGTGTFDAWTEVDASGRFALRVPLPSGRAGPLPTAEAWSLRVGDTPTLPVHVSGEAVRAGATVDGGRPTGSD